MNCNSVIGGGAGNYMCGAANGFIGAGYCNRITQGPETGYNTSNNGIVAGAFNCADGSYAGFIGGGNSNNLCSSTYSSIGNGYSNKIRSSCYATIVNGFFNCIGDVTNSYAGNRSVIVGGMYNKIANTVSTEYAFITGCGNTINHSFSSALGCGLTSTTTKTTYMNNATVACHLQVGGTTACSSTTGRIDATNDIVAYSTSDCRLKENIKPINNALCKLVGVSGNTFNWKPLTEEEVKEIHGHSGKDVGVIAQEIESILPEAVTTRDSGYKAVNYEKIVPLLIEAIKEQQKQIDELKSKV
jgi:hypothetical protein